MDHTCHWIERASEAVSRYINSIVPKPKLRRRKCGGWLAVSSKEARFQIGVTADTEQEAHILFIQAYRRWGEILDGPSVPDWARGLEWGPL